MLVYFAWIFKYPLIGVSFLNKHVNKFHHLALNISYYRKKQGLTQMQLAEKLGISRQHISNIEAPNVTVSFSMTLLFDIADALNVEPELFFNFK